MGNKWAEKLKKLDGAITERVDPWREDNLLRSNSPGVNWLFGNTHGMPFGHSMLLWGEPKAGKSLLSYDFTGRLHQDHKTAIAIKFDTEFRDDGQMSERKAAAYGIDLDRYVVFQVNRPEDVFDRIADDVAGMMDEGANVKLIIIDSITGIQGRREAEQESVSQHQIGDLAQTLQVGLKKILPVHKRRNVALILTAQARSEMDMWEQKRGNKTKAQAPFAVRHHCEYFVNVEQNKTSAGSKNELEQKFEDVTRKGMDDHGEQTAHKIKVWMQDNSMGPKNRVSEFTFDYQRGITNQHEEVFRLGTRWGVIKRPNAMTYQVGEHTFKGKPACLDALAKSTELQHLVVKGLRAMENTAPTVSDEDAEREFAKGSEDAEE